MRDPGRGHGAREEAKESGRGEQRGPRLAERPGFRPGGTGGAERPGAVRWLELHDRKTTVEAASRLLS